jgi:type I restriction enzyme, S subunit
MSNVREATLRELSLDISYGYTASANSEAVGPKFLRITDIVPYRVDWTTVPYCDIPSTSVQKYLLQEGDVVIARTGATTGHNFVMDRRYSSPVVFASYLIRYRLNRDVVVPAFLKYVLKSSDWYGYVENIIGGSAQPGANAQQFADFSFLLPTLDQQRYIAEVLGSLDDKIDLLHRQNQTLEQMAETLYRQCFVEEAKDDWPTMTVGDYVTTKGGGTPSSSESLYWNGGINWTSPRDLSGSSSVFMFDTERTISSEGLTKISSGLLPVGTVLLSSRAPIGYLAITDIPVAINQGYIACICDKGVSPWYTRCWIKGNMELIISAANGSTFLEIPKGTFRQLEFVVPPAEKLAAFDSIAKELFEKIRSNEKQIRSLQQTRDTLLPKLMSGELRVAMAKPELELL